MTRKKTPGSIRRGLCYVPDRARVAAKAGESAARDLDRIGNLVRVVPYGRLLLINGVELEYAKELNRWR